MMIEALPAVSLGQLLHPALRREAVEPLRTYPLLGMRLDGRGPFLRETKLGSELSASSVYRVQRGDFVYGRLFASRGAFGVIGESHDGCFVSSEFPVFETDPQRLLADYLFLWFRLPSTMRAVAERCSGSTPLTRNRLKEAALLAMKISLPPVTRQAQIVESMRRLSSEVDRVRTQREGIGTRLRAVLTAAYLQIVKGARDFRMAEIAPLVRRPVSVDPEDEYREIGIRSFGRGIFHKPPIRGWELGSKKVFQIRPGDLVFNIVFAWEGAVAVAGEGDAGRIGSHRFLTCVPLEGFAMAPFLHFHFLTSAGLRQLAEASPGGAGRNRTLGVKALGELKVPVPSMEKQEWFSRLQADVASLELRRTEGTRVLEALVPSALIQALT